MQQIDDSFFTLSKEELIKHFDRYGFTDQHGHPLTNCIEFLELIDVFVESNHFPNDMNAPDRAQEQL